MNTIINVKMTIEVTDNSGKVKNKTYRLNDDFVINELYIYGNTIDRHVLIDDVFRRMIYSLLNEL